VKISFPNGDELEAEYCDDRIAVESKGRYKFADGSIYEGGFTSNGKMSGQGT
jgi:hypothetical protein